jgi:hypothetical protein
MTGFFTLNLASFKSALVSAVLMGVLATALYVINIGDVWQIDLKALTNVGVMAFLTGIVSLIKNLLTDNGGTFAGVIKTE